MNKQIYECVDRVSNILSDGHSEKSRGTVLCHLLTTAGIVYEREKKAEEIIVIDGIDVLVARYSCDIFIADGLIIELKVSANQSINESYINQCRQYLKVFPEAKSVLLVVYKHRGGDFPVNCTTHTLPKVLMINRDNT